MKIYQIIETTDVWDKPHWVPAYDETEESRGYFTLSAARRFVEENNLHKVYPPGRVFVKGENGGHNELFAYEKEKFVLEEECGCVFWLANPEKNDEQIAVFELFGTEHKQAYYMIIETDLHE